MKCSYGLLRQKSLVLARIEVTAWNDIIVLYENVWYECLEDASYQGTRGTGRVVGDSGTKFTMPL